MNGSRSTLPLDRASVALVVNTSSRKGARALEAAREGLRRAGLSGFHEAIVGGADDVGTAMERALSRDPDLLVVAGGDGTVACAAGRVAHTPVVLGVLPTGTANDFARTLGIPSRIDEAVDTLVSGQVVDIDLGRVNDQAFVNVASLGLSVDVTHRLRPALKKRLGALAYPVATLQAYRHHQPFTCRFEFPDGDHVPLVVDAVMQVAIGNGVHYGGGNTVAPQASIDDHLLDVYAIRHGRLRDHVSIARLLKDGSFIEHEQVLHLTTRCLEVLTDHPVLVNADGELSATTPATFAVQRNAVHLIVPRTSTAAVWDGSR
jgi:diacylglycerol kinase (ATP)